MCGIVGFYNSSIPSEKYVTSIKKMITYIAHRGPDEAGYFVDDIMGMGTARLSIIDLKSGSQPLSDQSERYWICYNGELYNYKELREELQRYGYIFETSSDTEVVLKSWMHWQEKCLGMFNGAFAFSIYDRHTKSLFIGRDRYGKRPLFYAERDGAFLFASEMKAFLAFKDFEFQLDSGQLSSILAIWTPLPHQSGFKGIKQLPMGEYLIIKGSEVIKRKYEQLDFKVNSFQGSEEDAIAAVREKLTESVKLRLRSDVEVGVYLSGGLDSSIVTYLTTQLASKEVRTFSVEFEDKQFDESKEQRELVKHLGVNHSSLSISYSDIANNFPKAIYHAETPAFRTAFVPMYMLSGLVKKEGIKVVLSGEGADEAFLGYGIFKDTLLRKAWGTLTIEERKSKLEKMYPYLEHFDSNSHLLGLYDQFSEEQMPGLFSHEMRYQNGKFSNRLLNTQGDPFSEIYDYIKGSKEFEGLDAIQKAQWLEFKTLLSGYLLSTQGERMGLAHGIENRCPFMDPNVVNFASSVNLKFNDGFNEKYLLKEAFKHNLPSSIINRSKNPYRAPDSAAFVKSTPDYLEALLSDNELKKLDFINPKFVRALTNKIFSNDPSKISTKENQAFIFLLSITQLHRQFTLREGLPSNSGYDIEKILVKKIDKRRQSHAEAK